MDHLKLMVAQEQRKDIVARVEQDAVIAALRAGQRRPGAWQRLRALFGRSPRRPARTTPACRHPENQPAR
jgi:hypothetical protein